MALSFNGTDEYASFADHAALTLTPPWTVAGWFRITDATGDRFPKIFSWNNSLATPSANLYFGGSGAGAGAGLLYFRIEDGGGDNLLMDALYDVGSSSAWQHIAITASAAGVVNIYGDGIFKATDTNADLGEINAALPWYFARYNTELAKHHLPGELENWGKWNRILSLDEIASLWFMPPSALPKDLAWYWPGLADAKEHWAGLTVTDNSGGLAEGPPSLWLPDARPRYLSSALAISGGPFPHHIRRQLSGGMITQGS